MGFANYTQLQELLLTGGMGFLLGAYYDVLSGIRTLVGNRRVAVFVLDCLFLISSAVVEFLFVLARTDGLVRAYVLLGTAVGFAVYRQTVSRMVTRPLFAWLRRRGKTVLGWCRAADAAVHRQYVSIRRRFVSRAKRLVGQIRSLVCRLPLFRKHTVKP